MMITYSKVNNVKDNRPVKVEISWDEFYQKFVKPEPRGEKLLEEYLACKDDQERKHLADAQKDGVAIIPGEFINENTRSKADLISRYCLVLDLDDGYYTFEKLVKKMKGRECIIHTSYSHSDKAGKYRVYLLFDKPVTKDIEGTCSRILDYFESFLGKHIDDKCWTVSQIYFTPSCPPDAVELYRYKHIKGHPIRTSAFKLPKLDNDLIKTAGRPTGDRPGDDYNQRGNWDELLKPLGWQFFFTDKQGRSYWTRPGKRNYISGVVFPDTNVFHVFSSAPAVAPFEGGETYSLFRAYTLINYSGDFSAAASQLKSEGYGTTAEVTDNQEDADAQNRALNSFPAVPFPLDVLPDYFQELVIAYAKALQSPLAFMAMLFLTIISCAAGNAIVLALKRKWKTAPFIWFYIVGISGEGKSPPENAAMEPLHKLQSLDYVRYTNECQKYNQELAAYRKKRSINEQPPSEPTKMRHFYSQDFTIESLIPIFQVCSRGIVLHVDELPGLFNSLNQYKGGRGSDIDQLLSLFDCGPMKKDRKSGSEHCNESGIAVIGGIQPERLPEVFNDKMHENGMAYRFMPMILNVPPVVFTEDDVSEENEAEWSEIVEWMYEIPAPIDPDTGCIIRNYLTVEGDDRVLVKEYFDTISALKPFMPKRFKGYIPKLKTYCLKFMAVLHLLKCYKKDKLSLVVKKSAVLGAIKLTSYFAGQALQLVIDTSSKAQNPYQQAIKEALVSLQDEVKRGRLRLTLVRERVNELVPANMELDADDNKRLAGWLRDMGLEVTTGTANKTFVLWDDDLILS